MQIIKDLLSVHPQTIMHYSKEAKIEIIFIYNKTQQYLRETYRVTKKDFQ